MEDKDIKFYIMHRVSQTRKEWDDCDKRNLSNERKLYGKFLAFKEMADGLKNITAVDNPVLIPIKLPVCGNCGHIACLCHIPLI